MIVAAILASAALASAAASTASAKEQVGVFLAGEESENEEEQPRFSAETYPTVLDGGSKGNLRWDVNVGVIAETIECPVDLSGELSSASTKIVLSKFLYYFNCETSPYPLTITVTNTGCEDGFSLFNVGPPYLGAFGNECAEEGAFTFNLEGWCTVALPQQAGLEQVNYETTGEGSKRAIEASIGVKEGLKYIVGGDELLCGNGEYEDGAYSGTVTLEGFDE